MLALERHRHLLELVSQRGSVRTAEAARSLGVTEETVRRDFEKLEAEGELLRSHGGAVKIESARREFTEKERDRQHADAKLKIARMAAARIQPGQTILFDASTTAKQIAQILPDQPITVLTNSLHTALTLIMKPSIDVIVLGGKLSPSSHSCTGWVAERALEGMRIDTAYLSCRGFDAERGLSEASEDQARLKRQVISCAEEVCLVADASKAGLRSSYFFAKPADIDLWITDQLPAESFRCVAAHDAVRFEIAP